MLKISRVLLIISLTILLTGCQVNFLASQSQSIPQLVEPILSDPKTFNPVLSVESPNIFPLTFDGLVKQNPITAEIEPALAESWEFSPDNLKLTFKLRDNLKWSDGQPLTVDDVIFTYSQLYLNKDIPASARDSLTIGKDKALPVVTKIDQNHLQFTIPEPFAPFLAATGLPILPAHIIAPTLTEKEADGTLKFMSFWGIDTPPEKLVVNGPYQLADYQTSQRIIFKDNPNYWKKQVTKQNLPHIKKVVWQIVESTDTAFLQFRSGSLDSLSVSPQYFSLLKKEEKRGNFTIYNGGPAYGTTFISFNLNQGSRDGEPLVNPIKSRWFNNVKFRRAVAYAINRQKMINTIYRGIGSPQNSPISVQSPFYDENLKTYEYDIKKAKQLLEEAGFKYGKDEKLFDSQGNRVQFTLVTNAGNQVREAMGSQIQEDLGKVGIQVDFSPLAFTVMVNQLQNSLEWECILIGLGGGNEPHFGANVWFPDGNLHFFNQQPRGENNSITGRRVSEWEEKIGQLYIEGARETDFEKRKAIYAETQQLAADYLPFIYLVNPLSLSAVRNKFDNIEYSPLGGAFWNIEEIKMKN